MNGWKLISDKYINLDTELDYICPNNHEVKITYRKWREYKNCPICNATTYQPTDKAVAPKGKVKRVLALDDATHDTGWAIFDDNNLIKYGVYSVNHSTEVERISTLKKWLINIIYSWQPDVVIIEDIQLQTEDFNGDAIQNLNTYKVLAHLQGVLQNTLFDLKIPFETVYAQTWRKACEIKGRFRADKKKSAQLQVKNWYNIDVTNDEADAICIGRYYIKKSTPKIIRWE